MEELTINQALRQGVEAHQSGRFDEADRLYSAILRAQPSHPEANHNIGVLAVGLGKPQEALSFLKTALEATPTRTQFWLSYINTLLKLGRLTEAQTAFEQAQRKGAEGDLFDQLGTRLRDAQRESCEATQLAHKANQQEPNILNSVKLNQALRLAKKKMKEDKTEDAKQIYRDILKIFPKNKTAKDALKAQMASKINVGSNSQDPPQVLFNKLTNLYHQGQFEQTLRQVEALLQKFPSSASVFNLKGVILQELRQPKLALEAYRKAISIKNNYAEAYNNMGNLFASSSKINDAIKCYKNALLAKPGYADAYYNLGNAFEEQGKLYEAKVAYQKSLSLQPRNTKGLINLGNVLNQQGLLKEAQAAYEEAIRVDPTNADPLNNLGLIFAEQGRFDKAVSFYKKALVIKPDFPEAYNSLGCSLKEQGLLNEAIDAFNRALAITPDLVSSVENKLILETQLKGTAPSLAITLNQRNEISAQRLIGLPKYQLVKAISSFISGDLGQSRKHLENFDSCDPKSTTCLPSKDRLFCSAYSSFLSVLLSQDFEFHDTPIIFHIGESHCLSFAHHRITVGGTEHRIVPSPIFGAKAFHFANQNPNKYKEITNLIISSFPNQSNVFVSFGEIDCRPDEGFMSATKKLAKPIESLIEETVIGYLRWLSNVNRCKRHKIYLFNVPAPNYDQKINEEINKKRADTVSYFNAKIAKHAQEFGFKLVDLYRFTVSSSGFSNREFHIDDVHLGPFALPEIERQIA